MKTAVERLAEAIGYPETVPGGAMSFAFTVDGTEIAARETGGRLLLERRLWQATEGDDETALRLPATLARYAAGRILREEATLAWDPNREAAVLWQDVPASAPAERLRRFFEVFTASCDWWAERVTEALAPEPVFPEMVIMP